MNKGEIWITNLPEQVGKEQKGKRPVLILADTKTDLIIILPLTSNIMSSKYPNTIKIKRSENNGLDKDSVALMFQMRAVDKRRMLQKIGNLESDYVEEINKILRELLKI